MYNNIVKQLFEEFNTDGVSKIQEDIFPKVWNCNWKFKFFKNNIEIKLYNYYTSKFSDELINITVYFDGCVCYQQMFPITISEYRIANMMDNIFDALLIMGKWYKYGDDDVNSIT